jgi:hypothetical protein
LVVAFFTTAALAGAFFEVAAPAFAGAFFVVDDFFAAVAGALTPLGGAAEVIFFLGLRTLDVDAFALGLVVVFADGFFSVVIFLAGGATFSFVSVLFLGASLTLPLGPGRHKIYAHNH